jgi:hypothetical protein
VNYENPFIRLLAGVVAIAAALRLTWLLIEPVLPALAVAVVAFAVIRIVSWYRNDRW